MRCYTNSECESWLTERNRLKPNEAPGLVVHTESIEDARAFPLAHQFAKHWTYESDVLLWITEWGIWPSSENWHLFYKLRQTHHETRLLHEAPGHLYLAFEMDELASMLQLAILNGWGGYLLTDSDYVSAFFSHDEYVNFYSLENANLEPVRKWFRPA
jgi:hypothetical protein